MRDTGPTAAIAGINPGLQGEGVWTGRRQLFVRFAGEAETATLYTAEMLRKFLERATARGGIHSVALTGRDPLSCSEFLAAAFSAWKPAPPMMLDTDGQRPQLLDQLGGMLSMVQVKIDFSCSPAACDHAVETLAAAARIGCDHAAVLAPRDGISDGQLLRFVEQAHGASSGTKIVIHPPYGADRAQVDRHYGALLEKAAAIHGDVRLVIRIGN